ncbi:DUF2242 domain-containing protein [Aquabacterium sp. J223]|uniref:DUF2242 domain-containing protein n=1 Tax=Aquabacterium sp. J223 TaxID=2898431 RepID=UPI0021AE1296|nr:DUF2242 domain-containing protein [Aquabacterium sp. J223]UUX94921.1 DUF2242 domain-containing protein [Aquabacterium sp. J223]
MSSSADVLVAVALCLTLAGCAGFGRSPLGGTLESFDATDRFSRRVSAPPAQACEAARLALLSQGYQVSVLKADELRGRKNFQPQADRHAQVEVHVVCALAAGGADQGEVFVNAVQDRYELKKSSNAASIGVPAIASLSLPFSLGNDAMVKTASETIIAERFYDRFFEVLERYLGSATRLPSEEMAGTSAIPR